MVLSTVFVAYIASGVLAHPDWGSRVPRPAGADPAANRAAVAIVTATVGTTLAPWGLCVHPVLRGRQEAHAPRTSRFERVDVVTGAGTHRHYRLLRGGGVCGDAAPRRPLDRRRRRCRSRTATAGRHRGVDTVRRRPDRGGVAGRLHPAALDGLLGLRVRGHRSGCRRSVHRGQALLSDVRRSSRSSARSPS